MVFSSLIFLFAFLPFVLAGNLVWRKNRIVQNAFLLFASLLFYAWGEGERVVVMVISIAFNYGIGLQLGEQASRKKAFLVLGIFLNLAVLSYFKYAGFIIDNFNALLSASTLPELPTIKEKLPIGISFYTFQAISYLIDVYRGESKPQRNALDLGLYITLFPQLIAGPIVRYNDIAEQLLQRKESLSLFSNGLRRFIIGLAKKVLISNSIGSLVDQLFDLPPNELSTSLLWIGMLAYSLQLYFDFSGYSDMAIGLGKMLGFNIPENFNFPYIAKSIQDFWRRWHITLSVWFRDYLYIPLGGNRVKPWRIYYNLFIVFLLTGLWHGAGWNFIVWGLFHGAFLILERLGLSNLLKRVPAVFSHIYTLLVVGIAWIMFRAEDLNYALTYIGSMFNSSAEEALNIEAYLNLFYGFWLCIGILFATPLPKKTSEFIAQTKLGRSIVDLTLLVFLSMSVMELMTASYNPFIYFRF